MTCYYSLQDDDVSVFIFSCKFYSTHKQTHLQQQWCIKREFFLSSSVRFGYIWLRTGSVSTITFEQDAVLISGLRECPHGPGNYFLKRN